jgi:hypothetical protein
LYFFAPQRRKIRFSPTPPVPFPALVSVALRFFGGCSMHAPILRTPILCLAISQLFSSPAFAVSDAERIADLEKKLTQSIAQIERLANRVTELEKEKASAPRTAPPATATAASAPVAATTAAVAPEANGRIEALERSLAQITESAARTPSNAGLPLHGFADVGYASSSKRVPDNRKRGFSLGNADFYLTPEFGDHVKALIELNFEYGDAGELATDLERLQIGYTFNDELTLWAGRFHTPYGYWNTGFHHGAQIQTSVTRPRLVAFEDQGGILPAHTVGLWATGGVKAGSGKLEYDAYLGNGGRILDGTLDFNAVKDDNGNKVLGGNLRYRFGGSASGLVLGLHGFTQHITAYNGSTPGATTKLNMLGAYGFYDGNDWELISEYYHFRNKDLSGVGGNRNSWAGFVQVGRTFRADLTPFVRLEKANLDQNDNYFANLASGRSYRREVVGLRFDLNPKAAFKMEWSHTDESRDGGQRYNEAQLQYAIRF